MIKDQVVVMKKLGIDHFFVAHDRGARVAHRMTLDYSDNISKLAPWACIRFRL